MRERSPEEPFCFDESSFKGPTDIFREFLEKVRTRQDEFSVYVQFYICYFDSAKCVTNSKASDPIWILTRQVNFDFFFFLTQMFRMTVISAS